VEPRGHGARRDLTAARWRGGRKTARDADVLDPSRVRARVGRALSRRRGLLTKVFAWLILLGVAFVLARSVRSIG